VIARLKKSAPKRHTAADSSFSLFSISPCQNHALSDGAEALHPFVEQIHAGHRLRRGNESLRGITSHKDRQRMAKDSASPSLSVNAPLPLTING
jgi:hypothetical protein